MQPESKPDNRETADINASRRLTRLYILALTALAILTFGGQLLIQKSIRNQLADSRVINLAGSQRYLSQQIVKMCLLMHAGIPHQDIPEQERQLEKFLKRWKQGHYGLQYGDTILNLPGKNSTKIQAMFREIEPYFQHICGDVHSIIELQKTSSANRNGLMKEKVENILRNEHQFFTRMDAIVHAYDTEARSKVDFLKKIELLLFGITILILVAEGWLVFRPAVKQIRKTIHDLVEAEKYASDLASRLMRSNVSLEHSLKNLKDINYALDHGTILAKTDRYGLITYVNDKFCEVSKYSREELIGNRFHMLSGHYHSKAFFDHLWETISAGRIWNNEIKNKAKDGSPFWLDATIVPVCSTEGTPSQYIAIYSDVTARFKQSINEQKIRSASVIEGQEKERKKIARELHDGLGQMLTALKFNIGALKGATEEQAHLEEIKKLIQETILEVRRISFNLMPNVLNDFGIVSGIKHLSDQIGKNSRTKVVFENRSTIQRLNKTVEVNLYRIVQEALNNAIKYSEADEIRILLSSNPEALELSIIDNGKGFHSSRLKRSGNGIINIQERTDLLNGDFRIESAPGSGTKISIKVPFSKLKEI